MNKLILAENIRSLHNVGAIFRTADSAGWNKIILTGYTGCPPDRRIEKVSLGAENTIEWEHNPNPLEAIQALKADGYTILCLEKNKSSTEIFKTPITKHNNKIALIVGNEVEGVSLEALQLADHVLHIPMFGEKESLNVSIATGIALYAINNTLT